MSMMMLTMMTVMMLKMMIVMVMMVMMMVVMATKYYIFCHFIFQSEDLTQQTDIVKPPSYGILASPQRRKQISSGSSPQLKGSFLHRAVSAEKAAENSSSKQVQTNVFHWS